MTVTQNVFFLSFHYLSFSLLRSVGNVEWLKIFNGFFYKARPKNGYTNKLSGKLKFSGNLSLLVIDSSKFLFQFC